jgi:hypothetical protein
LAALQLPRREDDRQSDRALGACHSPYRSISVRWLPRASYSPTAVQVVAFTQAMPANKLRVESTGFGVDTIAKPEPFVASAKVSCGLD